MTVALFVTPSVVPVLIADTLLTIEGGDYSQSVFAKRNILARQTAMFRPEQYMARKIHRLSDRTAVACAGRDDAIIDFIQTIKPLVALFESEPRPMKRIAAHADNYRDLEVIGHSIVPADKEYVVHHCAKDTFDTSVFGKCAIIGSGGNIVKEKILEWDNKIKRNNQFPKSDPYFVVQGLVGALNNHTFNFQARNRDEGNKLNWGGYFESLTMDIYDPSWRWAPDTLHLFLELNIVGGKVEGRMLPVFYGYSGNDICGRLLFGSLEEHRIFFQESVFVEDPRRESVEPWNEKWYDWQPRFCTVSVIPGAGCPKGKIFHKTSEWSENRELICCLSSHFCSVGLEEAMFNRYIGYAASMWGLS